eukprot:4663164-Heterocapsa_arctica.AAC.1
MAPPLTSSVAYVYPIGGMCLTTYCLAPMFFPRVAFMLGIHHGGRQLVRLALFVLLPLATLVCGSDGLLPGRSCSLDTHPR